MIKLSERSNHIKSSFLENTSYRTAFLCFLFWGESIDEHAMERACRKNPGNKQRWKVHLSSVFRRLEATILVECVFHVRAGSTPARILFVVDTLPAHFQTLMVLFKNSDAPIDGHLFMRKSTMKSWSNHLLNSFQTNWVMFWLNGIGFKSIPDAPCMEYLPTFGPFLG